LPTVSLSLFKVAPSGKITNIFIRYIQNVVTVDATGRIYDDCGNAGYLAKLTPGGAILVAGYLYCSIGVAVDGAGDLCFANTGDGEVKKTSQ
jgi:hypothetical protein